ncbi:MAG: hypothetical protein ACTHNU_02710 [Gaiellales bacterium]
MDSWPQLELGRRYALNVAADGVVVRPRGVLAEVSGEWARIVHEEVPGESAPKHSCWVPLARVVTIAELEPRDDELHRAPAPAAEALAEQDHARWRRPRPGIDELTISVLGA